MSSVSLITIVLNLYVNLDNVYNSRLERCRYSTGPHLVYANDFIEALSAFCKLSGFCTSLMKNGRQKSCVVDPMNVCISCCASRRLSATRDSREVGNISGTKKVWHPAKPNVTLFATENKWCTTVEIGLLSEFSTSLLISLHFPTLAPISI